MTTPETISLAPAGFGTYGGQYLTPDFITHDIWAIPSGGGAPTSLTKVPANYMLNGTFLPDGYGTYGGQFLVTGYQSTAAPLPDTGGKRLATIWAVSGTGNTHIAFQLPYDAYGADSLFYSALTAPAGFGTVGGKLLALGRGYPVTTGVNQDMAIWAFDSNGTATKFAGGLPGAWAGAFAPAGFGNVGGELLVTDSVNGNIYAIDSDGNFSLFATVPLLSGQLGLRQLAFAPAGSFGDLSGDLFVSVAASTVGGGTVGSVAVLDGTGQMIEELKTGTALAKFDPRGIYFPGNDQILIADASDPIQLAARLDFGIRAAIPEPHSLALLALGMAALVTRRRKMYSITRAGSFTTGA